MPCQWEWSEGAQWTAYNKTQGNAINRACLAGKEEVTFKADGKQMKILFEKMVQKNLETGWERPVRCGLWDGDDFCVWMWEDEKQNWNAYSFETSSKLEENFMSASKDDVTMSTCGRAYTINIQKMEQVNDQTKVVRKVKRVSIGDGSDDVDMVDHSGKSSKIKTSKVNGTGDKDAQPTRKSSRSKVKVDNGNDNNDDGNTDAPSTSAQKSTNGPMHSKKAKSGKSAQKRPISSKGDEEEKSKVKTLVVKGRAPVDTECSIKTSAHVYCEGNDIYDAMLNQTNIGHNNNKFYLMQILEDDSKKSYHVWFRWGRVGKVGQNSLEACGSDLESAKGKFCRKFQDKTKNAWTNRKSFVKVTGKYDLVDIDYGANAEVSKDETDAPLSKKPCDVPLSKLDKPVQDLINLICDVKQMEAAVREMKFDAKRAPLGKLTVAQIKAGYAALKKVDACITNNDTMSLQEACSEFYTRIPHDFGMKTPPMIRTKKELKEKIQLLEALSDIEVAMKIIKESNVAENPIDTHYNSLKCKLTPLSKSSSDYQMIEDYLKNTHATTHLQYTMQIEDCFELEKAGEKERFVDHGNRMLLWHGSRLSNWVGILSQGLRIAPPEAPVTGYMFGKGVYFADMSSKSANYCFATRSNNHGLMLICEVSLGKSNELLSADYNAASLPVGCQSVMGKGRVAPNPKNCFKMSDGTSVPMGKGIDTGINNPAGYTLNYNEFIVYDVTQIKMRYLLRIKFNFK